MKRVIMVHGWQGTPDTHWKPWLKKSLEAQGFEVIAPQMPNPIFPKLSEWVEYLNDTVGEVTPETFFEGHSLGCITIVRYLGDLKEGMAGGAVLVAGFLGDVGFPEIEDFYSTPSEVEKAHNHCKKFTTILSDNDKDVPLEKGMEFQKALGAKLIVEKNKGHFTEEDGVVELPSVLKEILEMAK